MAAVAELGVFDVPFAEIVRASISSLEQGQDSGIFVDFRQRDSHYECITVAGVQEIIEKVRPSPVSPEMSELVREKRFCHSEKSN